MVMRSRPRLKAIGSPPGRLNLVSPMADLSGRKILNPLQRTSAPRVVDSRRYHPRQIFQPPSSSAPEPGTSIPGMDQPPLSSLQLSSSTPVIAETSGITALEASSLPSTPGPEATPAVSSIPTTSRKVVTVSASPFRLSSSTGVSSSATPVPTKPAQPNNLLRQPQFIIGVVCGGVALLGILIGLLVLCIRCRQKRRRKLRISAPIPWNSTLDTDRAEKGSLWGSSSYYPRFNRTYSGMSNHFADDDHPLKASIGTLDADSTNSSLGPLQITNLTPGDKSAGSSRASSVLDMPVGNPNEPGTPRELVPGGRPRFLGISGRGLSWGGQSGPSYAPQQGVAASWPRLPTPSPYGALSSRPPVPEMWTTSLKRSISTALGSLTGWVPPPEHRGDPTDSYLTPMPTRQFTSRYPDSSLRTPVGELSNDYLLGASYPMPSHPGSFATDTRSYPGASVRPETTHDSQVPLIATTQPPNGVCVRSDSSSRLSYYRGQHRGKVGNNEIHSSASSMYSQSSVPSAYSQPNGTHASFYKPSTSRQSSQNTVRQKPGLSTVEEDGGAPSGDRPPVVSRTSSSGCSVNSYYFSSNSSVVSTVTGGQPTVEMDRTAHSALIDRRRKARKVI